MWVMSRISCCSRFCRRYASSTITLRFLLDERFPLRVLEGIRDGEDVLIATARLINQDHVFGTEGGGFDERLRKGVRGLERRDQAFLADGELECGHYLGVAGGLEARPPGLVKGGQDGRDPDVVEASRNAVGLIHLPVAIL